jgi:formylmethanofuran dehydrogenase subunit E-like metal-binding protein
VKRSFRAALISEDYIKQALTEAKGDIFLAASALDCTAQDLDRYIRASAELQAFAAAIEKVKVDPAYSRMSTEQFETRVQDLTRAYKVVALDALHELATMNHKGSAAMAKVKMQSAIALRGNQQVSVGDREIEHALAELNQLYHANAPRIKEIRQTVVKLEDGREATQRVIELQQDPPAPADASPQAAPNRARRPRSGGTSSAKRGRGAPTP